MKRTVTSRPSQPATGPTITTSSSTASFSAMTGGKPAPATGGDNGPIAARDRARASRAVAEGGSILPRDRVKVSRAVAETTSSVRERDRASRTAGGSTSVSGTPAAGIALRDRTPSFAALAPPQAPATRASSLTSPQLGPSKMTQPSPGAASPRQGDPTPSRAGRSNVTVGSVLDLVSEQEF
jgi:hypothetical protein